MANRRLRMRQIRDILRLQWSVGLSMRSIAQSLGVGYGTVHDVLHRAAAADLRWPLPAELDDGELEGLLYQGHQGRPRRRPDPDWAVVDMELRRKGVTLELLWLEYKQAHPAEGYQYSQFCFHYRQWRQAQNVVLRQSYRGGEKMFVDYAGQTLPIVDLATGGAAYLFVSAPAASPTWRCTKRRPWRIGFGATRMPSSTFKASPQSPYPTTPRPGC